MLECPGLVEVAGCVTCVKVTISFCKVLCSLTEPRDGLHVLHGI